MHTTPCTHTHKCTLYKHAEYTDTHINTHTPTQMHTTQTCSVQTETHTHTHTHTHTPLKYVQYKPKPTHIHTHIYKNGHLCVTDMPLDTNDQTGIRIDAMWPSANKMAS